MASVRKNAIIATLAVSGSRVAGLLREIVFAFFFGAGPALDAFIAAFRIPNLLRDLFAEGALSNAFVTVFSQKNKQEGEASAWDLANRVVTFVLLLIGSLTLLGVIFSPSIVHMVASGFTGEKFDYTVLLNRILFPFILFVSLAAICMGMLNSRGKFALPQSASTFFNITSITVGLAFAYWFSPQMIGSAFQHIWAHTPKENPTWEQITNALKGMALGTLIGGLVQWLVQIPSLFKLGYRPKISFGFKDPAFKQVMVLTLPAIIGGAAVQVNVLINTNFASYLADGSMAWLNYAFRLMQFPIGIFGVAIASATTPALARMVEHPEDFAKTLRESTQLALFLCVPAAMGLILLASPIIALIYQYGRFGSMDTLQTAHALMAYAMGLSFYALIKIYQPAFLAFHDARTPMIISLLSILVNGVLNWVFVFQLHFAHWGLALGTSMVAAWNALMLIILLRKKVQGIWNFLFLVQVLKILFSSLVAVGIGWSLYHFLFLWIGNQEILAKLLLVFLPIGITTLAYYLLCSALKISEAHLIKDWVKKKL